jgi:hypothetical protein
VAKKLKAAKSALTDLVFPLGGLHRATAVQSMPPYTSPYLFNVRPMDTIAQRSRGGNRPGLVKLFASGNQTQAGNPTQLLDFCSQVAGSGVAASYTLIQIVNGLLWYSVSGVMTQASGLTFNAAAPILQGCQVGQLYYIADYKTLQYAGTGGVVSVVSGSTYKLVDPNLANYVANLNNDQQTGDVIYINTPDPTQANIFTVTGTGGSGATSYVTFSITGANAITVTATSGQDSIWQIGFMPKVFNPITGVVGKLFPVPVPPTQYTGGTVTVTNGNATLSGGSWSGVPGVAATNYTLTLSMPNTNGVGMQVYAVASINQGAGTLVLTDTTTDANMPAGTTYILAWDGNPNYQGVPPLECNLCCNWRGRLVFAGPGTIWYMSRIDDPIDFNYGADPTDPSRAVGGADQTTTASLVDNILALMPHSSDYLIMGGAESMSLMNGDPAYGGQIVTLSRDVGVLGPTAFCNLPDGSMVFLSRDGIYFIASAAGSYPQPISRPLLPAELLDVDWIQNTICMAYDVQGIGIHLSITPIPGESPASIDFNHWFIDWGSKRFWPMVYPSNCAPNAMVRWAATGSTGGYVVFGCLDGYLRIFSNASTTDDATSGAAGIVSLVTYGPLRFGGAGYDSQIKQIAADLDPATTGSVPWSIYGDLTAEKVLNNILNSVATPWSGTFAAGFNHRQYPLARGGATAVVLNPTGVQWAIEGLRVEADRKGPLR